ncbi:hypothetical protein BH23BAC1_BH23BAC1_44440 [soil metagenome]
MSKLKPYLINALKYGLIGGVLTITLFFILLYLNVNPLVASKRLDFGFFIIPVFVFFSIKEFRNLRNYKQLRFWQGMTIGFFTYLILAFISASFIWLVLNINNDLLDQYIFDRSLLVENNKDQIVETLGEEVFYQTYQDIQQVTPFILALDDFLKKIFAGLFITIIISVILRR